MVRAGSPASRCADLWVVSDQITSVDAVVVLGGGLNVRPFAAAEQQVPAKQRSNKPIRKVNAGIGKSARHTG